jgi:hypothetical protein
MVQYLVEAVIKIEEFGLEKDDCRLKEGKGLYNFKTS